METIRIQGARVHNLKNVSLEIPKQKLVVITGVSGSGKSSLAFDILFEEGKNQYLKSIGILTGLEQTDRFDRLEGIGPAVAIQQNTIRQNNPRSTVGSRTKILNELALVYASDGKSVKDTGANEAPGFFLYTTAEGMCMNCQGRGSYYDIRTEKLIPNQQMTLLQIYEKLHVTKGFLRLLKKRFGNYFETPFYEIPEEIQEQILYGTYENGKQSYCVERALKYAFEKGEDVETYYGKEECEVCHGTRINHEAENILIHGKNIGELGKMTIHQLAEFIDEIPKEELSVFGRNMIEDVRDRLKTLMKFRLGHLSLYREMSTLSGGELQRIFLHLHLESGLESLIYVFDEPMSGLHPSEKEGMQEALVKLRNLGNTVVVVEHDKEILRVADWIIEIGPKAGKEGGEICYQGDYAGYVKAGTLLSDYLTGQRASGEKQVLRKQQSREELVVTHADIHYLKDLTVHFPLHKLVGIAGMSGSGKSSLIEDTLLKRLRTAKKYGVEEGIFGSEKIDSFCTISQEPIGRSANSIPASYIGIWDRIRTLFAAEKMATEQGMSAGDFSFHSTGACEECNGSGLERIFLTSDFSVDRVCKKCHGRRYRQESLAITYRGKNIADVLEMSVKEAKDFFAGEEKICAPLEVLSKMGMGYLRLGQPTASLSGGEAQRMKLARELGKRARGNRLYVLDEPTTGLSMYDTDLLLKLLDELIEDGASVIVIEHNVEVLKHCDELIELGPDGGDCGGELIAQGTPEELKNCDQSITGRYL